MWAKLGLKWMDERHFSVTYSSRIINISVFRIRFRRAPYWFASPGSGSVLICLSWSRIRMFLEVPISTGRSTPKIKSRLAKMLGSGMIQIHIKTNADLKHWSLSINRSTYMIANSTQVGRPLRQLSWPGEAVRRAQRGGRHHRHGPAARHIPPPSHRPRPG